MIQEVRQISYLPTFGPNDEHINQVFTYINSETEDKKTDIHGFEIPDLASQFIYRNCVAPIPGFYITSSGANIIIDGGYCYINGVLIHFSENYTLNTNNSDSYFYSDTIPTFTQYTNIVVKYDPSESVPDAYYGLINTESKYISNSDVLCYLGVARLIVSGSSVSLIDSIYINHPTNENLKRLYPYTFGDGGDLDDPIASS
jgi:hypothetical protein